MVSIAAVSLPCWFVAGMLLVGACAASPPEGSGGAMQRPGDSELRLDGRTFASVDVTRNGAPVELVPGTQVHLSFSEGRLIASAGCNTMSGDVTYDDAVLHTAGSLAMTEMGCDGRRHTQDEWLASMLESRPTIRLERNDLTISRRGLVVELKDVEVLEPDRRLLATRWELQSIAGPKKESSVSSVSLARAATLVFTRHRANIFTGCNSGSAETAVSAGVVSFSNATTTTMGCTDERGDVENAVLSVLRYPCRIDIAGSMLTLTSRTGTLTYASA